MAEEFRFHIEQQTADLVSRGIPLADAERRARAQFGAIEGAKDAAREARGIRWFDELRGDLRFSWRTLRRAPGFTLVSILTLALGIGGTTAIFSAVNPILFQALPYPAAGQLAMIWESPNGGGRSQSTFAMMGHLAERARSFSGIAAMKAWQPTAVGAGTPERLTGQRVSAGYLQLFGVAPMLGRDFLAGDDRAGGPLVAILSAELWRRRFGEDPGIVGKVITLDDAGYQVIGVMPLGFENVLAPDTDVWAPLQYDLSEPRAWGHHLRLLAMLRPGVELSQAELEASGLASELAAAHPESYGPSVRLSVVTLQDDLTRGVKPALLVMLGAVALVLVIACVNVTNLLLGRGVERRGEFALRAALGAGQGRLVRQLLAENLLLALAGGAVGMLVAALGVRTLVALAPAGLPRAGAIHVNGVVFGFGLLVSTLIGIGCGVIPAFQAARVDPNTNLQLASARSSSGHRRYRGALVVVEVALAVVLLVGSGLLLRSLRQLFAVDAGFEAKGVLTMQVQTSGHRYDADSVAVRFFAQALEAVQRVPGVTAAGFTSQLPLSGDLDEYGVHFERGGTETVEGGSTLRYAVSPGYLEAIRIPLRRGRLIDERDGAGAPLVALLSESYARQIFPNADPIGRRLHIGPSGGPAFTVVGIVGDVRQVSLALDAGNAVYVPASQWLFPDRAMSLVVRTRGNPASFAATIRQAVWSVDRDQPIVRSATMDELLATSAADRRFALQIFQAFGLTALTLAAAGIYGVLAGGVAERTREIGMRSALGATRGRIVGLVVRQGLGLTGFGMLLGVACAVVASRTMEAMLFGVSRLDPVTYLAVIAILSGIALLACIIPARRAALVEPMRALRSE